MRRRFNDRLAPSEATDLVGKLLAQWPRAPQEEPYLLALAAALQAYPRCVAMAAIVPTTGVASEKTFGPGPTVADVVAWCDRESGWMRRFIDAENNNYVLAQKRAEAITYHQQANEDRSSRPSLDELRRKHGPSWGLSAAKQESNTADSPGIRKERRRLERKILAEYERIGQKPIYATADILISPALLSVMKKRDDDWGP